jgi:hypothetical protein
VDEPMKFISYSLVESRKGRRENRRRKRRRRRKGGKEVRERGTDGGRRKSFLIYLFFV